MRKYIIFISAIIISLGIFIIGCTKEEEFSPVKPSKDSPEPDNVNVNPGINGVVINEIYRAIGTNDIQWVEIFNPTDKLVDMIGWQVPHDWVNTPFVGFGNLMIQPNEYIISVMYNIDDSKVENFKTKYNLSDNIKIEKVLVGIPFTILSPSGDPLLGGYFSLVQLLNENLNSIPPRDFMNTSPIIYRTIDLVHYDEYLSDNSYCVGTTSSVSPGQSIARYKPGLDSNNMADDFYIEGSPTPGRENNQ